MAFFFLAAGFFFAWSFFLTDFGVGFFFFPERAAVVFFGAAALAVFFFLTGGLVLPLAAVTFSVDRPFLALDFAAALGLLSGFATGFFDGRFGSRSFASGAIDSRSSLNCLE